ncbi:CBS domain-containing protein (plasmid) [Nitratireductor aquimarinus]|uniref:CBS domain-containing protein n=1 Tax=Nitratireductor aquimarinus TaxID=889300 RepID=UPI003B5943C4
MTNGATLEAILQKDMPVLKPDMPIRRAVALLVEADAAAAPVVDDSGALMGIVTQKDCFRPALNASYYQEWKGTVADHMSSQVVTLSLTTDLTSAAEAFLEKPYRVFPVVDGSRLVGMLRRSDVLAALVALG